MGFVDKSNTFVRYGNIHGKTKEGFRHSSPSSVPEIDTADLKAKQKSAHSFIMSHL